MNIVGVFSLFIQVIFCSSDLKLSFNILDNPVSVVNMNGEQELLFDLTKISNQQESALNANNVDDAVVPNDVTGQLNLTCTAHRALTWSWTAQVPDSSLKIIESSEDSNYTSTLMLLSASHQHTGFFRCLYKPIEEKNNMITSLEEQGVSIYIYFYDGVHLLANNTTVNMRATVNQGPVDIDCRPTLPNITVMLYKDGQQIIPDFDKILPIQKKGFLLNDVSFEDSGIYYCQANNYTRTIILTVQDDSTYLSEPEIQIPSNTHFVLGSPFSLLCMLNISRNLSQSNTKLEWALPPSAEVGSEQEERHQEGEYIIITSRLHIVRATVDHTGNYTCGVSTGSKVTRHKTYHLYVQDSLEPFIDLSTNMSMKHVTEGETVDWTINVVYYPTGTPLITLLDPAGHNVENNDKITIEYKVSSSVIQVSFQQVHAKDFGNYSLQFRVEHNFSNITLNLIVNSRPVVVLDTVPHLLELGSKIQISCSVQGFPIPNIKFMFIGDKSCSYSIQNCSNDGAVIPDLSYMIQAPGNQVLSIAKLTVSQSGRVLCVANNSYGTPLSSSVLRVTDFGDSFKFSYSISDIPYHINQDMNVSIFEGQPFFLTCQGITWNHRNITMTYIAATDASKDCSPNVTYASSNVSLSANVKNMYVCPGFSGVYTCQTQMENNTEEMYNTKLYLQVLELRAPELAERSSVRLNKTQMVLKSGGNYSIFCLVTGRPRPNITWYKDEEVFAVSDGRVTVEETVIKFLILKTEDSATYLCVAENKQGKIVASLQMQVYDHISSLVWIGLGCVAVVLICLLLGLGVAVRKLKKESSFRKTFRETQRLLFSKGAADQLNPSGLAEDQADLLPYDDKFEISRDKITIGKQIGSGAFGRVMKATVREMDGDKTIKAALKMAKATTDPEQVRSLALELKIMVHLGKHLNIVNLIGASTVNIDKGELWILVEYCCFGNLLSFLHQNRQHFVHQVDQLTEQIDTPKFDVDPIMVSSPGYQKRHRNRSNSLTSDFQSTNGYSRENAVNMSGKPRNCVDNPEYSYNIKRDVELHYRIHSINEEEANTDSDSLNQEYEVRSKRKKDYIPLENMNDEKNAIEISTREDDKAKSDEKTDKSEVVNLITKDKFVYSRGYKKLSIDKSNVSLNQEGKHSDINLKTASLKSKYNTYESSYSPDSGIGESDKRRFSFASSTGASEVFRDTHGNPYYYSPGNLPGRDVPLTTNDLICWAWQIAQGMGYLATRKVLHGDLAARNLLLTDNNVLKISDFGMSRDMYKRDIYTKKGNDLMPIKWMSIEAIRDHIFSIQSDVWAFGVTLWEIFTLGNSPYPGTEINENFLAMLESGYRMKQPKYADDNIYEIILSCWREEPTERPSFTSLAECLAEMMDSTIKKQFLSLNSSHDHHNEKRFTTHTDYLDQVASPDYARINRTSCRLSVGVDSMLSESSGEEPAVTEAPDSPESIPNYLPMGQCSLPRPASMFIANRMSRFTFDHETAFNQDENHNQEDSNHSVDSQIRSLGQQLCDESTLSQLPANIHRRDSQYIHTHSSFNGENHDSLDINDPTDSSDYIRLPLHVQ